MPTKQPCLCLWVLASHSAEPQTESSARGRKSPASTLTLKDCISSAWDHHDLISSRILKAEGTLWRISLIIKAEESQCLSSPQATTSLWAPGEWWGTNEDHLCTEWIWDAESPSPSSGDLLGECDNKTLTVYAILVRHLLFTGKAILTWFFLPSFLSSALPSFLPPSLPLPSPPRPLLLFWNAYVGSSSKRKKALLDMNE